MRGTGKAIQTSACALAAPKLRLQALDFIARAVLLSPDRRRHRVPFDPSIQTVRTYAQAHRNFYLREALLGHLFDRFNLEPLSEALLRLLRFHRHLHEASS